MSLIQRHPRRTTARDVGDVSRGGVEERAGIDHEAGEWELTTQEPMTGTLRKEGAM